MLSYQHIYHAGNAADVQKHLWLIRVLTALKAENAPLFWLDTHAGRGLYDLNAPEARKLAEYRAGYLAFRDRMRGRKNLPPGVKSYLQLVDDVNKGRKGFYPGSALIAARMLETGDRLHLCEMHKGEIEYLKKAMKPFPGVTVVKENGYEALAALTPPPSSHRGGVLIDPSYEVKTEYAQVLESVRNAHAGWRSGVFLIWYPILKAGHHKALAEGLRALDDGDTRVIVEEQLFRAPEDEGKGMAGTGMVIINPPR